MILHTFEYEGNSYEIKINNRVRKAINDFQVKNANINISEEALEVLSKLDLNSIDTKNESSLTSLLPLLPYMSEFSKIGGDSFDTLYVILHTLYPEVSQSEFDKMIDKWEEEIGSEKLCKLVGKIVKDAFTETEKLNKALNQ